MVGALTNVLSLATESSWGALVSSITPNNRPAAAQGYIYYMHLASTVQELEY